MSWRRKFTGGTLAFIGFLLSPLSWWNDLFVNVPLAYVFASLVSWFHQPAFGASFVLGYWLTNVLGLVLLQKGAQHAASEKPSPYTRPQLTRDLLISLGYTLVIVLLVQCGVLAPLPDYLPEH